MVTKVYNPNNWYWFVGGATSNVFSSKANSTVPVTDADFVAWSADGTQPTTIDTQANLVQVLLDANVAPYLTVTPRQARLALSQANLLTQVENAVSSAGGATKITWDYATVISRVDPMIAAIGASLNLSAAQIDALFALAATL